MDNEIKKLLSDSKILLNAVSEGIYGFDTEGKAVFINAAAEKLTGWNAQELLGKHIHQYHHHSHADGSHYPAHECKIYATAQDGKSRRIVNEVFWRKDGQSFPVEYTSTPVYHQNILIGAVAVFRDISKQKSDEQALRFALDKIKQLSEQLQVENTYLHAELKSTWAKSGFSGDSAAIQKIQSQIALVAKTDSTVLILGENGTGKELAARQLHQQSQRSNSTMVKVNCAAFTPSLLESELFGHEKGAFTGAIERRQGKFELANKGTLFLDEVGELSLEAQSKLLRVIQEQEFERVGGSKTIKVDIRIIAATNQNLQIMVEQGSFRMDLYYRLNVFPIEMPPLRDRITDIPVLSHEIIKRLNTKLARSCQGISQQSLDKMSAYDWPGNVRELQNILEREIILSDTSLLTISNFTADDEPDTTTFELEMVEKNHILKVLGHCNWQIGGKEGAAKKLGLPDSTLRSKMAKLSIHRPS